MVRPGVEGATRTVWPQKQYESRSREGREIRGRSGRWVLAAWWGVVVATVLAAIAGPCKAQTPSSPIGLVIVLPPVVCVYGPCPSSDGFSDDGGLDDFLSSADYAYVQALNKMLLAQAADPSVAGAGSVLDARQADRDGAKEGGCDSETGHPVMIASGNKVEVQSDFAVRGLEPISVVRYYNHDGYGPSGIFGPHWFSAYDMHLDRYFSLPRSPCYGGDGQSCDLPHGVTVKSISAVRDDGSAIDFQQDSNNSSLYRNPSPQIDLWVTHDADGGWTLHRPDGGFEKGYPDFSVGRQLKHLLV